MKRSPGQVKIRCVKKFGLLLATTVTVLAFGAAPAAAAAEPTPAVASLCTPGTPAVAPATTEFYDPAQAAFGPATIPAVAPVGPLLRGYHRFGTLAEERFSRRYRNEAGWIYPPDDGFVTVGGFVLRDEVTLKPGRRVDRFGYPGGAFLAPSGTPFTERALPPSNLNTPTGTGQANYHKYCVLKAFAVDGGPIAPWFEQAGLGVQYKLVASYVPGTGGAISVTWLLDHHYLVEEKP